MYIRKRWVREADFIFTGELIIDFDDIASCVFPVFVPFVDGSVGVRRVTAVSGAWMGWLFSDNQ